MKTYAALNPVIATGVYTAVVGLLVAASSFAISDLLARRAELASTTEMLDRLSGRGPAVRPEMIANAPSGSPFLEGQTLTIAAAALQQKVVASITKVGGSVLSSQVDLTRERSKDGVVGLIVSCDMEQPALQTLLYDLEAGMPFLFVEQLTVQTAPATTGQASPRLRVMLEVSGRWQGNP